MKTKRAYRYRFYPTEEQVTQLACTFGCGRFVYNWGLSTRKHAYFHEGKSLYYHDLAAMLPTLKQNYPFLAEVSSVLLQQALRHLERAFSNFFEGRADYPTFKKKRSDQSVTYAAKNIRAEGLSVLAACGGSVRPGEVRASQAAPVEAGTSGREARSPGL